jgi:hypothetical protein
MSTENEFYDILRSKFSEKEEPFDEKNWKSMRNMIDASRAAKRRVLWLAASAALLIGASAAFGIYEMNNNSGKQYSSQPVTSGSITPASANNNLPINNSSNSTNSIANNNQSNASSGNTANVVSAANNQQLASTQATTNGTNGTVAVANNSNKGSSLKRKRHSSTQYNQSIAASNEVSTITDELNAIDRDTKVENTLSSAAEPTSMLTRSKAPVNATPNTVKKETVSVTKTNVPDTSTSNLSLPQRFSDEPRVFNGMTNIFTVEAGAEYSGGWLYITVVQGQGWNPTVGLAYTHYLGKKWFLKTGLQFSTFGNMSTYTYNYQHITSNAGHYTEYDSVITTKRLYFLRLPVQFERYLGHKISGVAGGTVWYLLGNSGTASTYQQYDNNPPTNLVTYGKNAPLNGYTKVDASAHLGARYTFSRKFSLYGMFYYEFINMKDNAFFGEDILQRTKGFQFLAAYKL